MWYIVLFAALLGADQLIKYWTVEHLALGESASFLPGIVQLTRVHNYGAAWSSFSGQTTALAVVTVLLMGAVAYLLVRRIVRHPLGVIAGVMILAGGVGNLIDRLFRGYVVDMFDPVFLSGVQLRRLLRGGGGDSGGRVLPVLLRQIRQEGTSAWKRYA